MRKCILRYNQQCVCLRQVPLAVEKPKSESSAAPAPQSAPPASLPSPSETACHFKNNLQSSLLHLCTYCISFHLSCLLPSRNYIHALRLTQILKITLISTAGWALCPVVLSYNCLLASTRVIYVALMLSEDINSLTTSLCYLRKHYLHIALYTEFSRHKKWSNLKMSGFKRCLQHL